MAYLFAFNGGTYRNSNHVNEKFFMLGMLGGKELFLHQCLKAGLVEKLVTYPVERLGDPPADCNMQIVSYRTEIKNWKVFMSMAGFGVPKRTYSLYFELFEEELPKPVVSLRSLSQDGVPEGLTEFTGAVFVTKARMMTRDESLAHCSEESARFVDKMNPIPVVLLKRLLTVNKDLMRGNVRQIKMKRRTRVKRPGGV